ncbi:lysozyme [Leptolyngbya sp. FACHB-16]|uniref:lysozyme n=1 Tax=unclassified Leptolyngbya TaxID=2650499 RepID=UPI001686D616|nr:lysozyme [Leptolyngbya sp. FACHB-16]MBD2156248.1 lysozyme [Leptolyngbya sp. FACHB-16]
MKATITHSTVFKDSPRPSAELTANSKLDVPAGQELEVLAYRDGGANHLKITFNQNLGPQRRNTWYVYKDHIQLEQPGTAESGLHISEQGLALIKKYEGFRSRSYLCPSGTWTIGYGSTHDVTRGQWISEPEAAARLRREVQIYEHGVLAALKVEASQAQFDALVSLCYNIGVGAIARSSVMRFHNRRDFAAAADAFLLWNKGGGKEIPGLTRRRREERSLYLT